MTKAKRIHPHASLPRLGTFLLGATFALSACVNSSVDVAHISEAELSVSLYKAPPNTREGSCWARDETPATVQTTTEQFLVSPAETDTDGNTIKPASYRTETRQEIVHQRDEIWFETPCGESIGEDFILNLQRALTIRGYYNGPINGVMDGPTRGSIRKYQQAQGLNSSIVSLEAAQQFGLQNYILN